MALLEEFENQGNFLFRWRSYVPSLIVVLSFFYLREGTYFESNYTSNLYLNLFFFVISLFGLLIRCFTIGYAPEKTSGRNTKTQVAETVNQTGIYSLIRHPLYVGNFFMFLGVVLILKSLSFTIIFILFYWMYYERIMFTEEQFLRRKFGASYTDWASKTPAILPKLTSYRSPNLPFSFKNILKREYPSLFGIILMFLFYDIFLVYKNEPDRMQNGMVGLLYFHHQILFLFAIFFYSTTRIVVKFTKLLHVEGR